PEEAAAQVQRLDLDLVAKRVFQPLEPFLFCVQVVADILADACLAHIQYPLHPLQLSLHFPIRVFAYRCSHGEDGIAEWNAVSPLAAKERISRYIQNLAQEVKKRQVEGRIGNAAQACGRFGYLQGVAALNA